MKEDVSKQQAQAVQAALPDSEDEDEGEPDADVAAAGSEEEEEDEKEEEEETVPDVPRPEAKLHGEAV